MEKLKLILDQINFDQKKFSLKDCKLGKVSVNSTTLTYTFVIEAISPINPDVFIALEEAFLNHKKNYKFKLSIKDISNQKTFLVYWESLFKRSFIGKELASIHVEPVLEGDTIKLLFNLQSQINLYKSWEETILKELNKIGFDVKIKFGIKEDAGVFKDNVRRNTMGILAEKNRASDIIKASNKTDFSSKKSQSFFSRTTQSIKISDIKNQEFKNVELSAMITSKRSRAAVKSNWRITNLGLFDGTQSITAKFFEPLKNENSEMNNFKVNDWVKTRGEIKYDTYEKELMLVIREIKLIEKPIGIVDDSTQKRIEFSAHTKMSSFDGVVSAKDLIKTALKFGHKGLAITDQDNVQSFPEAMYAYDAIKKNNPDFKLIYGSMMNMVEDNLNIIQNETDENFDSATYIIFDLETTGISAHYEEIIEFAAAKIENDFIVDKIQFFVKTSQVISPEITELTNITQSMSNEGLEQSEAIKKMFEFFGNSVLVAHNAQFDIGFLKKAYLDHHLGILSNPWIDTIHLAWKMIPGKRSYTLGKVCKYLQVEYDSTTAHRADYDVSVLAKVFIELKKKVQLDFPKIKTLKCLKQLETKDIILKQRGYNINIYAKNQVGIKNLYKIISEAHIDNLKNEKRPCLSRSYIEKNKDNLIIASGGNKSEIIELALNKTLLELRTAISFYDFILINPPQCYNYLVQKGIVRNIDVVKDALKRIIEESERQNIMVIAVADPFFLEAEDQIFRDILVETKQLKGAPHSLKDFKGRVTDFPNKFFKTTNELIEDFNFLGDKVATQIVSRNTNILLENFEEVSPLKKGLFVPKIDDSKENLLKICLANAYKLYGNPLPKEVDDRLQKELNSIVKHNFDAIYYISHLIVKKSLEDGYLVGSRGSVGSSFAATMAKITEVNPLRAHYLCKCTFSDFDVNPSIKCGFDLPPKECPSCDQLMFGQGHDIPFETFLGFEGDKIPDIDLNFSGDYQSKAHDYTKELFGEDNVFRAGTISTVADKTAFGYVKQYQEVSGKEEFYSKAEVERLRTGLVGTKRTTSQHPGGIMVLPKGYSIYDFTPVNFPANEISDWKTTHFDYHAIHDNLLKLDLLGHVDPTAIRMLQDMTGVEPDDIPFYDEKVLKLFSEQSSMGFIKELPLGETTGGIGIPEFGTNFVRDMLSETNPKSFGDLVIISGLSHGTNVYRGNSRKLIMKDGKRLSEVIGCRDNIMTHLISKGLSNKDSFDIMEFVRKGKVPSNPAQWSDMTKKMKKMKVEDWWIDSCEKIEYLFPKAHATAYVMMAWRVAWFKIYYPLEYYASLFSLRCDAFEIEVISAGESAILERYGELLSLYSNMKTYWTMTKKEKDLIKFYEMALEMYARGFSLGKIDLMKSSADLFIVNHETKEVIPPFSIVDGLGDSASESIIQARTESKFGSILNLKSRTKLNKTSIELLGGLGVLKDLPPEDQMSLFE